MNQAITNTNLYLRERQRSVRLQAQLEICQIKNRELEQENAQLREWISRLNEPEKEAC